METAIGRFIKKLLMKKNIDYVIIWLIIRECMIIRRKK